MSLVDPEEFAQFTRLRQLGMPRVAELIMELLKLDMSTPFTMNSAMLLVPWSLQTPCWRGWGLR